MGFGEPFWNVGTTNEIAVIDKINVMGQLSYSVSIASYKNFKSVWVFHACVHACAYAPKSGAACRPVCDGLAYKLAYSYYHVSCDVSLHRQTGNRFFFRCVN